MIDYEVIAVIQLRDNTEKMEEKDKWMDQQYVYRWNKQDMVVDCALEMMKRKEKVSSQAYGPKNWINGGIIY